ncbi:ABC transporter substrate-binding protein [Pseudoclavibacter chungangensis]|uniref:ABC transporter substrate-binding protein n=1 Tax=Pseudoclavibacter chungangensis TaxID=587635 RepID=A0A7J5BQ77_9MICO|nr:ABC transporter substrate-binding protein [Pseudoclavibacter chungangensis]KAB1654815.1 ABC transporter substrate-binding protein [Pseudoclavibacter chungangensis]NYJ68064.1 iron complex transport system substrate-binding protein [Pseudoclavibacter chungangensis]
MSMKRPLAAVAIAAASALLFGACASGDAASEPVDSQAAAGTVQIEDNFGTQTVATPPQSVVALDNSTFQTLADWNIPLSAASRALMPSTNPYKDDESILDVGTHREPNLEVIAAAEPDLVITGGRFSDYYDDIKSLVPDATVIDVSPKGEKPLVDELKHGVTVLGEIFGKQTEAQALGAAFDSSVTRATEAYDPAQTVMAVNTSGGEIGYLAPGVGRTLGPVFDLLSLTPALEVEGASDDHQGDDISVEAIAQANPDWILVMDRDAAINASEPDFKPAADVLAGSEALAGVTAVQQDQIVYMPADTYTNESIQTYTVFLGDFADALGAKK